MLEYRKVDEEQKQLQTSDSDLRNKIKEDDAASDKRKGSLVKDLSIDRPGTGVELDDSQG